MIKYDETAQAHRNALELLPWYLNGTLTPDEHDEVERHLEECTICQQELVRCQAVERAVERTEGALWMPTAEHFETLLGRIEDDTAQQQRSPSPHASGKTEPPARSVWQRFGQWLRRYADATPTPARWALAGQAALIALLAVFVLSPAPIVPSPAPTTGDKKFETFTKDKTSTKDEVLGQVRAQIVFGPQTTEETIRTLLREAGASIVKGPSKVGLYVITLESKDEAVRSKLESDPAVKFARWR